MVDSPSGAGAAQGFRPPVGPTFTPGQNAPQRAAQESLQQNDPAVRAEAARNDTNVDASEENVSTQSARSVVAENGGQTENVADARRGSIVNITV